MGWAPSAVAAQVIADDLGISTENTAKWWRAHETIGATFHAGQPVIVDEASLAGILSLDRITGLAENATAKVLLVGGLRPVSVRRRRGELSASSSKAAPTAPPNWWMFTASPRVGEDRVLSAAPWPLRCDRHVSQPPSHSWWWGGGNGRRGVGGVASRSPV
ncbi:AAA family ATPase [Bifidobacterium psychraerophilum]|uniref:AAA family ATPase n=1 Tax=Bifidobacterium psychraerophilum TaxID=218140 RepID=UPI0039F5EEC9